MRVEYLLLLIPELVYGLVQHGDVKTSKQPRLNGGARFVEDDISRREMMTTTTLSFLGLACSLPLPATAMTTDKKTGIALPDPGEIAKAIPSDWSDIENPFAEDSAKTMFSRLDSKPDSVFYSDPRFVEHVDDNAVRILTEYVSNEAIRDGDSCLDLCSSWTSHFRPNSKKVTRFAGLGMNTKELEANGALTEFLVQDLNINPKLPYEDNSFDTILCQLSIDYLVAPLQVLKEASRVLKPGGKVHILFSNRLFLSKAVGLWTGADDIDHAYYVGCYLHFCGGAFTNIVARDLSTRSGNKQLISGDPVYVVTATKKA